MKIERFAGNREARQALVLAVAGVTAVMLIMNLILMAVIDAPPHYLKEKAHRTFSSIETASIVGKHGSYASDNRGTRRVKGTGAFFSTGNSKEDYQREGQYKKIDLPCRSESSWTGSPGMGHSIHSICIS